MIGKEQKQKDVELLKRFIEQATIRGFTSNLWCNGLRTKYPYEYIQLMRKYRDKNRPPEVLVCDAERMKEAQDKVHRNFHALNQYLIHPPESEEEKKDFDYTVRVLEGLLEKMGREN